MKYGDVLRADRAIAAVVAAAALLVFAASWLPYPVDDLRADRSESYRLYDRHGTLLREVVNADGARARWTPLGAVSENVVNATLAAEDVRFYEHGGVDWRAVVRALWHNVRALRIESGASTITMQMVRLHRGYAQRSLWGKLRQTVDAWRVERALSKKEILEQYLNRAPYGAGTIGIEAASQRYFGKTNEHLSVAEAAMLAALPRAPSQLNPLRDLSAAQRGQRRVLDRMLAAGMLEDESRRRAALETLHFVANPPELLAGHFTDYVMSLAKTREIHTTLDLDLQRPIERLQQSHVESLESGGLTNAAVVVLDNESCELLAMTGSVSYWDDAAGAVNGALARRQPGSALKPFIYALAFTRDFGPASVLSDIPTQYPGGDGSLLRPRNYSERFVGPVLAKDALGRSLNVPAIRLTNAVGNEDVLTFLRAVGFTTFDHDAEHYGLGLALGNGEVTLLELAQAYAMLARGGEACETVALLGAVTPAKGRRVLSEQVAFLITEILFDETLRIRAFGANNPLLFGYPVAVKTGTSSNWRDSVAVGFTARHTVAVWSGDFSGKPMHELSGSVGAGPLFRHVIELLVGRGAIRRRPRANEPPENVDRILVCRLSGMAPTEHCPHHREMWVPADRGSRQPCSWHRPMRLDVRNGLLAAPKCPSRFVRTEVFDVLPPRFAAWQASHPHATRPPPARYSPLCPLDGVVANAIVVTHPRTADVFLIEPGYPRQTQTVSFEAEVDPALPTVDWFVDGDLFATADWPYEVAWALTPGQHQIFVVAGTVRSDPVVFEVR